ncbi:MAG TPA: hypothetical protein VI318_11860 [Baekduia sp.]
MAALVVGGGVAGAAQVGVIPGVHAPADHPLSAREVAHNAMVETRQSRACRPLPNDLGATTTTAQISSAAATLVTGPADPRAERQALSYNNGGPVVGGSARRVDFPDGSYALTWVAVGLGPGSLVDPAACGQARIEQLHRDLPDPGSRLRQKAEAVLRGYRDVIPGVQMLWVMYHHVGARGAGGSGVPLDGRTTLRPGILSGGSGGYVGYAAASVVRVTADGRDVHRSVVVRRRLFALKLPRGTGPVVLRQRAADGRVLATETIRE